MKDEEQKTLMKEIAREQAEMVYTNMRKAEAIDKEVQQNAAETAALGEKLKRLDRLFKIADDSS